MTEASSDNDLAETSQGQSRSGFLKLMCIIIIKCHNLKNREKEICDRKNQRRKITQSKLEKLTLHDKVKPPHLQISSFFRTCHRPKD